MIDPAARFFFVFFRAMSWRPLQRTDVKSGWRVTQGGQCEYIITAWEHLPFANCMKCIVANWATLAFVEFTRSSFYVTAIITKVIRVIGPLSCLWFPRCIHWDWVKLRKTLHSQWYRSWNEAFYLQKWLFWFGKMLLCQLDKPFSVIVVCQGDETEENSHPQLSFICLLVIFLWWHFVTVLISKTLLFILHSTWYSFRIHLSLKSLLIPQSLIIYNRLRENDFIEWKDKKDKKQHKILEKEPICTWF